MDKCLKLLPATNIKRETHLLEMYPDNVKVLVDIHIIGKYLLDILITLLSRYIPNDKT